MAISYFTVCMFSADGYAIDSGVQRKFAEQIREDNSTVFKIRLGYLTKLEVSENKMDTYEVDIFTESGQDIRDIIGMKPNIVKRKWNDVSTSV